MLRIGMRSLREVPYQPAQQCVRRFLHPCAPRYSAPVIDRRWTHLSTTIFRRFSTDEEAEENLFETMHEASYGDVECQYKVGYTSTRSAHKRPLGGSKRLRVRDMSRG